MIGNFRSVSTTLYARLRREPALMPRVTAGDVVLSEATLAHLSPEMRAMLAANDAHIAALPAIDPASLGRHLDIEKAWHAVHFIVAGTAWETDDSEPATLCVLGGDECGEDAGYGPARLHGPAAVAAIAAALPAADSLRPRYDPAAFERAEIYPGHWETAPIDETWDWIAGAYDQVRALYREAARAGHAVVVWID